MRAIVETQKDEHGRPLYYAVIDTQYNTLVIRTTSPGVAEYWQQQTNKSSPDKPFKIRVI